MGEKVVPPHEHPELVTLPLMLAPNVPQTRWSDEPIRRGWSAHSSTIPDTEYLDLIAERLRA